MTFYRNICLLAGTVTLVYIVLRMLKGTDDEKSKKGADSNSEAIELGKEENSSEKPVESTELIPSSKKRKLEVSEGAMKILRSKPNFFIAFQVYNSKIHRSIRKLQEKVITQNPALYPALINISTLHVTLAVTHLASEMDIKKVKEKMDEWAAEKKKMFFSEPIILHFIGVNTFNDVVAFVDIKQDENCKKLFHLAEDMNTLLSSAGFSTESKVFKPHLTFLKLSRDLKLLRVKKKYKKDFVSLKECKENFGEQVVSHIQLLSMNEPKDQNGYYKCFHEIGLQSSKIEMDHSICCSPIPKPTKKK